ncbi:hypothetical protein [Reinekea marinisedimentorum]|uniref:Outer membrane protein with beta-barrel domain n=1 Tax=Reinekea marinisedimentorum TaxID=230495 RepID=A0A4R3IBP5_9GAMM|nr:hypothetical protein [Reinekea marinisedimentorum]TCS43901.1 hypothetical protein BCF53_101244 [Reinekea marinisedimentorum]
MCIKNLVAASVICLSANVANAFDIEPFIGWDVTRDPAVGISEYSYTNGSDEQLVAGDGFGLLIGSEFLRIGDFAFDARIGAQFKSMDATDTDGYDISDAYYFFPVFLNLNYDITRRWSVAGGASILLYPTFWRQYDGEDAFVKADTSYGFNAELRFLAIPASLDRDLEAYYVLRYIHNDVDYTKVEESDGTYDFDEYNDDFDAGLSATDEIRAIQFGLKLRF